MNSADKFGKKTFLHYHRYVDDIIIFSKRKRDIKSYIQILNNLKLLTNEKFSTGKTSKGFEYLGYQFHAGYITPKKISQERFLSQIFRLLREAELEIKKSPQSGRTATDLEIKQQAIYKINLKIVGAISENKKYGWLAYYCHGNSTSFLHKLDAIIKAKAQKTLGHQFINSHNLRSTVASYYDMKFHSGSKFALNFNMLDTNAQKMEFIIKMGVISQNQAVSISQAELNKLFSRVVKIELRSLQSDTGYIA